MSSNSPKPGPRIGLVACCAKKLPDGLHLQTTARDLYISHLFRQSMRYAEATCDEWYILSAKHLVVKPNQLLWSYDETLNRFDAAGRRSWSADVLAQLKDMGLRLPTTSWMILAGNHYRKDVVPTLERESASPVSIPLKGLRIGEQLAKLKEMLADLTEFNQGV